MSGNLIGRAVAVQDLRPADVSRMYDLFSRYFVTDDPISFRRDLGEKRFVIRVDDAETGELRGFSTVTGYVTSFRGRNLGVIYSGDTIICPECWGTSVLPRAWIRVVTEMARDYPRPLYWLLLSSGYKTYRYMTVFFRDFYPRYDRETPPDARALMGYLAAQRFGTQYRPDEGIVRFERGATPLQQGVAEVSERRLRDPNIAFFVRANPGHARGEELVCLAEVADGNITSAGHRILHAEGVAAA